MADRTTRLVRVRDTIHYPDCRYVRKAGEVIDWRASAKYSDDEVRAMADDPTLVSACRVCMAAPAGDDRIAPTHEGSE